MTTRAEEITAIATRAINSNLKIRNSRAFHDEARQSRIKSHRRNQLREWIAVLRIASVEANLPFIRSRLRDSGPLMGHDLRNRVILAGLDARIAGVWK